jgi:hypothetical protein
MSESEEVQVYLLECDTWSDGEEYHEEDHNLYYDTKSFHITKNILSHSKIVYSWNVFSSNIDNGLIMEWTNSMHINEIENSIPCETITKEKALSLINKELIRLRDRAQLLESLNIKITDSDPRDLVPKIEEALLTF